MRVSVLFAASRHTCAGPVRYRSPTDPRLHQAAAIAKGTIPGAVVYVAQAGKPLIVEAQGNGQCRRCLLKTDALFRIASMSKPITSVAIMMLVDEGKVKLDDPVSKYIPEFADQKVKVKVVFVPRSRPVTIRDLLTHTSGIAYGLNPPAAVQSEFVKAKLADGLNPEDPTLENNTKGVASIPLVHQPGAAWTYGMNTDVLGRVVEVASGQSFDRFLAERLFTPLKMVDTSFVVPAEKAQRLVAHYHRAGSSKAEPIPNDPFTSGNTIISPKRSLSPMKYFSGGAGLVSTASDYARFLQMMLNEGELDGVRILKASTVRDMTSNQIGPLNCAFANHHGDKFGYGFGIYTKTTVPTPGSYSWGGMYHTYFWVDPQKKLVAVVMTQLWPWGNSTFWGDFQKAVYGAMGK
jgi:CubicO group peptidase (beta-lactamase class C family)